LPFLPSTTKTRSIARGKVSTEQIPNAREKKRDALRKAVDYLGEASLNPIGFAPADARLLGSLADARERLARTYQEELTGVSGEARQALVQKRDKLRQEGEEALKHAKEILFAGNVSRSDPDFRNIVLAEGTIVFGREAGAASDERTQIFRRALAHYQEAATLFPDDPRPVFYAGLCFERLYRLEHAPLEKRKLFESAESAFRKALGLSISAPEYHPLLPYRGLASLYTTAGDFRSALDVLRKVQQSDPSYSRANGVDREIQSIERYLKR
jgi:tetratricopeptide (TPR) repeat protein